MSPRPAIPRLALGALLLFAGACASSGRAPRAESPFDAGPSGATAVEIHVRNFNFADATVWTIAQAGRRERLGVVTGKTDAVFTLPWSFTETLRIEFDLLAGPRCLTEALTVDPGDILELQIAVDADADPTCVRR